MVENKEVVSVCTLQAEPYWFLIRSSHKKIFFAGTPPLYTQQLPVDHCTRRQRIHKRRSYLHGSRRFVENARPLVDQGLLPQHRWHGKFLPDFLDIRHRLGCCERVGVRQIHLRKRFEQLGSASRGTRFLYRTPET